MERIKRFLAERESDGLLRTLRPVSSRRNGQICLDGKKLFDFSSNDYLGLSCHPKLKTAAAKATEKYGVGSSASRLLSGDLDIHHELEERTALFKGKESALVFNSGYQANIGIISAMYKAGDAVFCDKLSHASILDGALLSGARLFRFRHNDMNHLEQLLKKTSGKFKERLIVTESVFSMDGDRPSLVELVSLKERYGCKIMVDEAHATGIFGPGGSGVVAEYGLTDRCELIMGTFSKAMGSFGAYLACSNKEREFLINACRSFIYSTALPPPVIVANIAALEIIAEEPSRRERLLENASYFRSELQKKEFEVRGQSQIVPVIVGEAEVAVTLSKIFEEKGYRVPAIRPPTVPSGQSRLRFSLTSHHDRGILQRVVEETGRTAHV